MDAPALSYSHDPQSDIVSIEGVEYMGLMFRALSTCEQGDELLVRVRRQGSGVAVALASGAVPLCSQGATVVHAGDAGRCFTS